jgi:hypothetical protein
LLEKSNKDLEKALTTVNKLKDNLAVQHEVIICEPHFTYLLTHSITHSMCIYVCVQRYNRVSDWCSSFQDAMTECLPDTLICTVNRKLKEDLKSDSLLGKSRLGILLDALQSTTLSCTYKELIDKAEQYRAGNDKSKRKIEINTKCKHRTKKRSKHKVSETSSNVTFGKGKKQLAREGVLSKVIAINIESIRKAHNKSKM